MMKLLIVDDQAATLHGLSTGIDWEAEGFHIVDTAQNAMAARLSFSRAVPDVMLCDVEMPVESGLDLCQWVRSQGYQTSILILTCHSDFDYAKEAISLRVTDFIVQPAPYEEIRSRVAKAVTSLIERRKGSAYETLGKDYFRQKNVVISNLWRSFLSGNMSLETLQELPNMPDIHQPGFLVLQHLTRWRESDAGWRKGLLLTALGSFVQDIFGQDTACVLASFIERNTYAVVIQPSSGPVDQTVLIERLNYLADCYDMYMPCSSAFYTGGSCEVARMPELWSRLVHCRDRDSEDARGAFLLEHRLERLGRSVSYHSQKKLWQRMLQTEGAEQLVRSALGYLDSQQEQGNTSRSWLVVFHRDWLETISDIPGLPQKLDTLQGNTLSGLSCCSCEDMRKYLAYCAEQMRPEHSEQNITDRIRAYIENNLYEDICKEDVAEHVHLNADYITRVFKRDMGCSIKSYLIRRKMEEARRLLQTTSLSVGAIAMQLGYGNFSHFAATYRKEFGINPGEEQRKPAK